MNFDAPAVLRKWPSLANQRTEDATPYLLVDGTLYECLRELMTKPTTTRHLYEIHTAPQPPLVSAVLSGEHIVELARLRNFFDLRSAASRAVAATVRYYFGSGLPE
jgi:hypothetical protein